MAYKYETQYNSPNYTPGSQAQATWGQPFAPRAIAIHWWGDPNTNPTYEGVIATLCNPNRGASSHFVATGTGRRVAQLVNLSDASWATNSANPWTISIECDPRCRDEDYDVVAELISQIRDALGDLPLVPHRQFVATACPGNYDLGRLDRLARTKDGTPDWGQARDKAAAPPADTRPEWQKNLKKWGNVKVMYAVDEQTPLRNLANTPQVIKNFAKGTPFEILAETKVGKYVYYLTKYAYEKGTGQGFDVYELQETDPNKPVVTPPKPEPETPPVVIVPEQPEKPSDVSLDPTSTTLLQDVKKLLQELIQLLKSIFNK